MPKNLVYIISFYKETKVEEILKLPQQLTIVLHAAEGGGYLVNESTKSIFDEFGIRYHVENVLPNYAVPKNARINFFKRGRAPKTSRDS